MKAIELFVAGIWTLGMSTPQVPVDIVKAPAPLKPIAIIQPLKPVELAELQPLEPIATPAPAPAPTPPPVASSGSVQDIIIAAANEFGVSADYLLNIARCESTFNPGASNGTHFGLFQFLPSTYAAYAPLAGAGSDYWDASNNARTAAYMFSTGQARQWECK